MAKLLLSDFLQVVPTSGFGRSYITLADSTPGFESKFGVRIVREKIAAIFWKKSSSIGITECSTSHKCLDQGEEETWVLNC
ncbi:hypothetical protein LINPERPRIM_LOCUS16434 [Linum perenne]